MSECDLIKHMGASLASKLEFDLIHCGMCIGSWNLFCVNHNTTAGHTHTHTGTLWSPHRWHTTTVATTQMSVGRPATLVSSNVSKMKFKPEGAGPMQKLS